MSVTVYINHHNERARVHEDECGHIRKGVGGGNNGEYRYFSNYDEAWEWMEENIEDYEYSDCHHCNPEEY
ncbi:hypothetical protein JHD46_02185 [Sulfurimonas sp. SAG-AH-194-C20]|nr:hypothetical protein [Sulfurimonas sp. SAG-AH-194-C20]MDF1878444.1 hypothetical protein [Sulfurimonas sp. SAG-AH-194-C20]